MRVRRSHASKKNTNFAFEKAATANSIDEIAQAKNGSTHTNLPNSSTTSESEKVAGSLAKGAIKAKDELINLVDDAFKSYLKRDLDDSSELHFKLESCKLITEAELTNLTKVKPTGANNSYIGATEIANNAKRATPAANSTIANKVDDYITTTSTSTRGTVGEEIAEELVRDMDGFTNYPCKLNASDNGFDVVAVKGSLENPIEIRLLESKPMNNGSVSLGTTASKGTQMSDTWIDATIVQMQNSTDANLKAIGNLLSDNRHLIQKFVTTIDKDAKQIVIIKLNDF